MSSVAQHCAKGDNVRNSVFSLEVKSPISSRKAEYEVALRGQVPRGVSSNHVLRRAFGDAYLKHENVRHATLLFCAEGVGSWLNLWCRES
jgi:hypothetical protein